MAHRPIDSRLDFLSPLILIDGIGPAKAAGFAAAGITNVGELLRFLPRRYIDRTHVVPLAAIASYVDKWCCIRGTIDTSRMERGRKPRFRIRISDETGSVEAVWFNGVAFIRGAVKKGDRVILFGKVSMYGKLQFVHPQLDVIQGSSSPLPFVPIYTLSAPLKDAFIGQKAIRKAVAWLIKNLSHYPQVLPKVIVEEEKFPSLAHCLATLHQPPTLGDIDVCKKRLIYEELYQIALTLRFAKQKLLLPGRSLSEKGLFKRLAAELPFTLTNDQHAAIAVLFEDAAKPFRMHRLLQGDVGSGKTVVACCACLPALENGLRALWLAPTDILARQTYAVLTKFLSSVGYESGLLCGSMSAPEKKKVLADCVSGKKLLLVGTHALLSQSISLNSIGIMVIDEQHKFGAAQRLALLEKDPAADLLLMSATPIPQTLVQTLYGDLETVTIKSAPSRSRKVLTRIVPDAKREGLLAFIEREIHTTKTQAYWITPRIEDDDSDEESDLDSHHGVIHRAQSLVVSMPKVACGAIHGRQSSAEREQIMAGFVNGEVSILASTSIVEVGVDVPNASIMVIEHAQLFGLSQLHQLRGRIGRKGQESWCFLLADVKAESVAASRLAHFCSENDGFKLAEADLAMRGPGDAFGIVQSGWHDLRMQALFSDIDLFRKIQHRIDVLLTNSERS